MRNCENLGQYSAMIILKIVDSTRPCMCVVVEKAEKAEKIDLGVVVGACRKSRKSRSGGSGWVLVEKGEKAGKADLGVGVGACRKS